MMRLTSTPVGGPESGWGGLRPESGWGPKDLAEQVEDRWVEQVEQEDDR